MDIDFQHWYVFKIYFYLPLRWDLREQFKIGIITRCYDMFLPKYDFEHYDSSETPWSLYVFLFPVLFLLLFYLFSFPRFFPAGEFSVFFLLHTPLHSYLTLSVRQFALLFYLYLYLVIAIFRYCFPLISHTVVAISFHHISFLASTVYLSLLLLLYSLMIHKVYSYTPVLHMTTCSFCILLPSMLK